MIHTKFTDNSNEVLRDFMAKLQRGAEAVGQTAVGYAKEKTPVDTGNLKNSEDCRVVDKSIHIGTDVKYAPYQEFGTSRGVTPKHFLRDSVANHSAEYKNIIETSLNA